MSSILKVDTIQNTGGNDLITTGSNTTSLKNPNGLSLKLIRYRILAVLLG